MYDRLDVSGRMLKRKTPHCPICQSDKNVNDVRQSGVSSYSRGDDSEEKRLEYTA